jgi:DNA-binding CsgD family transcriptional regulator
MSYQEASPPEATAQRRHSKFTPEGIQQIKDLVARGETCQQIATIIGVTVGTLKVTCSRLGISLRRPKVKLLPQKTATGTARTVGAAGEIATFTINMKYQGQEHSTALPLTPNMISHLALEACFRDQEIGELAKDILVSALEKGLIQELLGELRTPEGGVGKVATRPGA